MFALRTGAERAAPARVLKAVETLHNLRPIQTTVLAEYLAIENYMYQAVALLNRLFPDQMPTRLLSELGWWDVLATVLSAIEEADWFWIDWQSETNGWGQGTLDYFWEMMWSSGEPEMVHDLAAYLVGIPVRCFGFTEEDSENYEAIRILRGLVDDKASLGAGTLVDLGLYDNLTPDLKESIREGCMARDWSDQPEPLCWLGEMVAIAARATGNVLLDTSVELWDGWWDGWWPEQFTWEKDVEMLKAAWREAKPMAEHRRRFMDWLWEDDEHPGIMIDLILGVLE